MKAVMTRLLLLAFIACAQTAAAQTADDIVEKHLAAIGGRAALEKLTSRSTTGTITVTTPGGNVPGTIQVLNQRPNKSRTLMNLDLTSLGAGPMTRDQRFDGTAGYVIDSLQGNAEITGGQLEAMRNTFFPTPILNYKERGVVLEVGGKEKVDGRDAFVLVLKPKTGPVVRQYLDADSYLTVRIVTRIDAPQVGEVEQTSDLSDYRDVDGIKIPFSIKVSTPIQSFTIAVTKVEHNVKVDDALFSKPASPK
jgi:outer membrane lipoprotein-sorting protein